MLTPKPATQLARPEVGVVIVPIHARASWARKRTKYDPPASDSAHHVDASSYMQINARRGQRSDLREAVMLVARATDAHPRDAYAAVAKLCDPVARALLEEAFEGGIPSSW